MNTRNAAALLHDTQEELSALRAECDELREGLTLFVGLVEDGTIRVIEPGREALIFTLTTARAALAKESERG